MYPRIIVDLEKYRHNVRFLKNKLAEHHITMAAVTKVFCAYEPLVQVLLEEGVELIADSRIQNLKKIGPKAKRLLLRLPMLSQVDEVIANAEMALVSEQETLLALEKAAVSQQKDFEVIIMVDLGDLREGMLYEDVIPFFRSLPELSRVKIKGLGVNLTCYGGILPTQETLSKLAVLKDEVQALGYSISLLSGGNSSSLYLLDRAEMPTAINMLRLGEALALGTDTSLLEPIEGMAHDVFTVEAELVEVKFKPSKPWGKQGADAFGNEVSIEDRGPMTRGILAIGKQDVNYQSLSPRIDVELLGSSSDHLIVNLKEQELKVGDIISFDVDYGSLLQTFTSPYVEKVVR